MPHLGNFRIQTNLETLTLPYQFKYQESDTHGFIFVLDGVIKNSKFSSDKSLDVIPDKIALWSKINWRGDTLYHVTPLLDDYVARDLVIVSIFHTKKQLVALPSGYHILAVETHKHLKNRAIYFITCDSLFDKTQYEFYSYYDQELDTMLCNVPEFRLITVCKAGDTTRLEWLTPFNNNHTQYLDVPSEVITNCVYEDLVLFFTEPNHASFIEAKIKNNMHNNLRAKGYC
jgi:hypothetical protein